MASATSASVTASEGKMVGKRAWSAAPTAWESAQPCMTVSAPIDYPAAARHVLREHLAVRLHEVARPLGEEPRPAVRGAEGDPEGLRFP